MLITPQTNIRLLKVPLTLDNKNQLTFKNKQEQFNFFSSLPYIESNDNSYLRHDGKIRYAGHIDNLINYNYCMYQNSNYSDKWFYAFISNMSYENENCTSISFQEDVWQTWQFDLIFKHSFVEREMINVADDFPGSNLIPESLETGEHIIAETFGHSLFDPVWCIAYLGETIRFYFNTTRCLYCKSVCLKLLVF